MLEELAALQDPAALSSGAAAKLKGKLQFVASHYRGRYGRSFLKAFSDRQYGAHGPESDAALRCAIDFWTLILSQGAPARSFAALAGKSVDGVLFTDGYAPDYYHDRSPDPTHRSGGSTSIW